MACIATVEADGVAGCHGLPAPGIVGSRKVCVSVDVHQLDDAAQIVGDHDIGCAVVVTLGDIDGSTFQIAVMTRGAALDDSFVVSSVEGFPDDDAIMLQHALPALLVRTVGELHGVVTLGDSGHFAECIIGNLLAVGGNQGAGVVDSRDSMGARATTGIIIVAKTRLAGNVAVVVNDNYTVSGSGIVERLGNEWKMLQPWGGFDLQIVASPNLKSKKMTSNGRTFEVVYTDFADVDVDSALVACDKALRFYTKLFKTNPSNHYIKFLVVPSRGGGISRKNFIAYTARRFNENFKTAICHEMGHFWWNKAPTFSWEDWLNEGFAEFSMLWYIKCHFSKHIFDCYLEACCENARHACPIYEVDRDSPEAYDALYNKGALLLYDLSQKVGEEKFFGFIQGVAEREISSTGQLLKYAEDTLGHDVKEWIEDRIKS